MAVFTVWWSSDTFFGWSRPAAIIAATIGALAAVFFVVQSMRLLIASRKQPVQPDGSDRALGKRNGRAFGLVFAAEGVLIALAVVVLSSFGLDDFVLPVIALIVGLHFYPMARIFNRSIDVWLATWTTLVAIAGIVAVALDRPDAALVWAWVGAGVAAATVSYGLYMAQFGQRLLRLSAGPSKPAS